MPAVWSDGAKFEAEKTKFAAACLNFSTS
ncbi:hypothetical protein [Neisseria gonorrhoeae]